MRAAATAKRENGYRDYAARTSPACGSWSPCAAWPGPEDAGRLARLCLERGAIDADLAPLLAGQRAAIARQRADLDRLEGELLDLETTIAAAGRARPREAPVSPPIRVLFVCTHNSARSQIAEALLQHLGGSDFEAHSAGTEASRRQSLRDPRPGRAGHRLVGGAEQAHRPTTSTSGSTT